jgi:tetratricopeptide (TPR) repeat protein
VELDEENVSAWLWLSGVVDSLDERGICLENVLALDPNNDAARRGLASVRQQRRQKEAQSPSPASEPESPVVARARTAPTPAAAILREDFASRQPPPGPEPEPPLATTLDQLDDEFLCPYCAVPTEPKDRKCKACGSELWIKFRRQEKRSTLLWVLIAFQFFNTFQLAMLPVLVLGYAIVKSMLSSLAGLDASDPLALLNVYLGRPTTLSPGAVHAALAAVPRSVFILSFLPCLFSGVVLIGLYLRWKPVYYLFMADALVVVATALMAMFLGKNLVYGGFGLGLALLRLLLVFQIEDDFQWEKRRLVLGIDRGLASGADFVIRGDFYAKRKMWAMAAIHLQRAVGWMPTDPGSRMALAVAYIRLKRYDRAAQTLAEASRISPGNPRVAELTALLDELRSAGSSP